MGKLVLDYDITKLRGADYNPRMISEVEIEKLRKSIQTLGIVKPLIVNGNLLIAGHQRTKALLSLGLTTAPVYILDSKTNTYDEVRFNQLHNGTDLDCGEENCRLNVPLQLGFQIITSNYMEANFRSKLSPVRQEISSLILKYGSWGACVATESGEVIHAAQYAMAAKLTNTNLTVFVVPSEKAEEYRDFLNSKYGHFHYEHLPKRTYIQSFAQRFRLRNAKNYDKSTLYKFHVEPFLAKNQKLIGLDFGSGQGDYAKKIRELGYNYFDVEFFRRKGSQLNLTSIHSMIDQLIKQVSEHGLFDFVVCDSVMNSVDSLKAEKSVLTMLSFFCKEKGTIFFSGRPLDKINSVLNQTYNSTQRREVEFLDINGFSALFRKGEWFYQKFHSKTDLIKICSQYHFGEPIIDFSISCTSSWQVICKKQGGITLEEYIEAIKFEFNLPLPDGTTINRHDEMIELAKKIYS